MFGGGCDEVRSGVLQLSTGAWFDPPHPVASDVSCKHGNPNVLTRDQGTSRLAQGPSALSCLVEIEVYSAQRRGYALECFFTTNNQQ